MGDSRARDSDQRLQGANLSVQATLVPGRFVLVDKALLGNAIDDGRRQFVSCLGGVLVTGLDSLYHLLDLGSQH